MERCWWRVAPRTFLSSPSSDPCQSAIDRVFSAFRIPSPALASIEVELESRPNHRPRLRFDGLSTQVLELPSLTPLLEGSVLGLSVRRFDDGAAFHASVIEVEGRGLALFGDKGSGKSTLAALLAARGHRYFGDELALVDFDTTTLRAYPKASTIKHSAFDLFNATETFDDPVRGPVRYFSPPSLPTPFDAKAELDRLFFPSFDPDRTEIELERIPPEELALLLVRQSFGGLDRHPRTLPTIVAMTKRPAYRLYFGPGERVLEFLETSSEEIVS